MRCPRWPLLLLLLTMLSGCGYHTAGQGTRVPATVKTLAIISFVNRTQTYRIEQTMTAAVVREFISRSRFKVLNEETPDADAVLKGTVLSAQVSPLTYDSQTGRASSAQVTVTMRVSLVDRGGKTIYENPNYIFREQYQVSREISAFFEEESPALDRMARDFARTLVSDLLENY
ncbi:MAG: LptE family protein [Acidobacteriales bacterium]|nr:LptE family protein [Terriglobales bacterium]